MSDTIPMEFQQPRRLVVERGELVLEHGKWTNPRTKTGLEDPKLAELADSIKAQGMLVDPHIAQIKGTNGHTIKLVIDGQRRCLALDLVYPPDHLIEVIDLTDGEPIEKLTETVMADLLGKSLTIGQHRAGLSSYEMVEAALRLKSYGDTGKVIAAKVGMSESWVSKMLKAREQASPKLVFSWQSGEITDEQFKMLAAEKDKGKQSAMVKEIAEIRKSGDKTEARVRGLEVVEKSKKEPKSEPAPKETKKETKVANGHNEPQQDMFSPPSQRDVVDDPEPPKADIKKSVKPSGVVLTEMLAMADKRPPTHDYVKGLMDGVRYAQGELDPENFGKAWKQYLARIGGASITKPKKADNKAKKSKK